MSKMKKQIDEKPICKVCDGERVVSQCVGFLEFDYSPCPKCGAKETFEEDLKKFLNKSDF